MTLKNKFSKKQKGGVYASFLFKINFFCFFPKAAWL
jgi:hypothetical protein